MNLAISAKAEAQAAHRQELADLAHAFLQLHDDHLPNGVPGNYEVSCHCKACGRETFPVLTQGDQPLPGSNPAVSVFLDEELRHWRIQIRRANDNHQTFFVRTAERCPVLAFALAELRVEMEGLRAN